MGELLLLCKVCEWQTNRQKINGLNDIFCRDWWEISDLIDYIKDNYKGATK